MKIPTCLPTFEAYEAFSCRRLLTTIAPTITPHGVELLLNFPVNSRNRHLPCQSAPFSLLLAARLQTPFTQVSNNHGPKPSPLPPTRYPSNTPEQSLAKRTTHSSPHSQPKRAPHKRCSVRWSGSDSPAGPCLDTASELEPRLPTRFHILRRRSHLPPVCTMGQDV